MIRQARYGIPKAGEFARIHRRNSDEHKDKIFTMDEAHRMYEKLKPMLVVIPGWVLERAYTRRYNNEWLRPLSANGFYMAWKGPKTWIFNLRTASDRKQVEQRIQPPTFAQFCEAYRIVLLADVEIVGRTK